MNAACHSTATRQHSQTPEDASYKPDTLSRWLDTTTAAQQLGNEISFLRRQATKPSTIDQLETRAKQDQQLAQPTTLGEKMLNFLGKASARQTLLRASATEAAASAEQARTTNEKVQHEITATVDSFYSANFTPSSDLKAVLAILTNVDSQRERRESQWREVDLYATRVDERMRGEPQIVMVPSGRSSSGLEGPFGLGGLGSSEYGGMVPTVVMPTEDWKQAETRRHRVRDIYERGNRELEPLYAEQNVRIVEALPLLLAATDLVIAANGGEVVAEFPEFRQNLQQISDRRTLAPGDLLNEIRSGGIGLGYYTAIGDFEKLASGLIEKVARIEQSLKERIASFFS